MNVLIINPIIYTSETRNIPKVSSIKDSMIYDLCLAFYEEGHNVTLYAAEQYKPTVSESYPFEIIWDKCSFEKIFSAHRIPILSGLKKYIKNNRDNIDLIITGEVFSFNSLTAYRKAPKKTIVWHELAKHNRMLKKLPSKLWYNIIARFCFKNALIIPRSADAGKFIKQYCKNVSDDFIDHGVNLDKFSLSPKKDDYFIVCSQLIERKKIDGIIEKFAEYIKKFNANELLYIVGSGDLDNHLKEKVAELKLTEKVIFTGKLPHSELVPLLSKAKALLINTIKDNSMISIVESIAVATPIVTTTVPLNSEYIIANELGIAKECWTCDDLNTISTNNDYYISNCLSYRDKLSTKYKVKQFYEYSQKQRKG